MTIPQTTIRYYDSKGSYREIRFHDRSELEAFKRRLAASGGQILQEQA